MGKLVNEMTFLWSRNVKVFQKSTFKEDKKVCEFFHGTSHTL